MTKPLSPIHRPLDIIDTTDTGEPYIPLTPPIPSRIARLAQLDSHSLSGRQHSLGPGGASAMFTQAVQRALVEEMAFQLRHGNVGQPGTEIGEWAFEIIAAFCEE
jgi:hypothetical protein